MLLDKVLSRVPAQAAEAVIDLGHELGRTPLVQKAASLVLEVMSEPSTNGRDDGESALTHEILRDLDGEPREDEPLREGLARALEAFATKGAREAYTQATSLIDVAKAVVDSLTAVSLEDDRATGMGGSMARRTSVAVLRDLDLALMERHGLYDLLALRAWLVRSRRTSYEEPLPASS
jgi:hypothetical protein